MSEPGASRSAPSACQRVLRRRGVRLLSLFSPMLSRLTDGGGSELGHGLDPLSGVSADDLAGDTHAGLVETTERLALHPEWVEPGHGSLPRRSVDGRLAERAEVLEGRLPPDAWHSPRWKVRHLFAHPAAVPIADRLLGVQAP